MTAPDAVRAMLGARSVAVVGASARAGQLRRPRRHRVCAAVPAGPAVHLVNPRYDEVQGLPLPARPSPTSTDRSTSCCSRSATTRWRNSSTSAARPGRPVSRGVRVGLVAARGRPLVAATGWHRSPPARRWRCAAAAAWASSTSRPGVRAIGYLERDVTSARPGRSRLALGLGVLRPAAHPPADRLDVGGVVRAGARDDDGRLRRARAGRPGDACGRTGARDGARAAAAAGCPRPRPRAGRPGGRCSRWAAAARPPSW